MSSTTEYPLGETCRDKREVVMREKGEEGELRERREEERRRGETHVWCEVDLIL
jgi:hypothetical protein